MAETILPDRDQDVETSSDDIDRSEDTSMTDPFDPELIHVENRPMTIDLLVQRIRHNELDLEADFQREGGIWKKQAKSRLIESILVRIPLPTFYLDATNEDKWIVIDGLQRLMTLKQFVVEETLSLSNLEFLKDLNRKKFAELPRNFQRRILETQVTVYLIQKGTPPEVRFTIFRRINTGGLPLSLQEIRHALNQGQSTKFLSELSELPEFKMATGDKISSTRMEDREFVLRFLAFLIVSYREYSAKEFDSFLNSAMQELNKKSLDQLEAMKQKFIRAMVAAEKIFYDDAFRKRYKADASRLPINKALFEAWSVNLSQLSDEQISILVERKERVKEKFMALMGNVKFNDAISQATGNVRNVKLRFGEIEKLIQEVLS